MQTFYSGSAKYTNISRRNQVSMALFLCADIHQGDELFNVHSGGKQCAFMSLRRFLQPSLHSEALPPEKCGGRVLLEKSRQRFLADIFKQQLNWRASGIVGPVSLVAELFSLKF